MITDEQMAAAAQRYLHNTPTTKEAYFYRELFEQAFPTDGAAKTVPGGKSIACSTEAALKWDEAFANMADPSGRAVKDVHENAVA